MPYKLISIIAAAATMALVFASWYVIDFGQGTPKSITGVEGHSFVPYVITIFLSSLFYIPLSFIPFIKRYAFGLMVIPIITMMVLFFSLPDKVENLPNPSGFGWGYWMTYITALTSTATGYASVWIKTKTKDES